jgi:hypothetical protein
MKEMVDAAFAMLKKQGHTVEGQIRGEQGRVAYLNLHTAGNRHRGLAPGGIYP